MTSWWLFLWGSSIHCAGQRRCPPAVRGASEVAEPSKTMSDGEMGWGWGRAPKCPCPSTDRQACCLTCGLDLLAGGPAQEVQTVPVGESSRHVVSLPGAYGHAHEHRMPLQLGQPRISTIWSFTEKLWLTLLLPPLTHYFSAFWPFLPQHYFHLE